ncbi:MAG: 4-hydroxybenzoate octaprenyltransferase [Pseudomonadota bacterium]|nr:4-hydroxybenzoate octaprenyltransferase [Pseudomonadota bacterium]
MFKKIKEKCKNLLILGRYNNPTGAFLLMWPCYWGALSNIKELENLFLYLLYFSLGAFIMRGAGCCINDILDKDFDKKVARTKNRPLASGLINVKEAVYFILFQLIIGLLIVLQFETKVIVWSFLIIPMVFVYPLFKRIIYFPQLVLGLVFNWGVIIGYLCQNSNFNFNILYLYFAGVFLTTAYDTIYGFQDIKDDKRLGLKSLAIFLEKRPNYYVLLIYLISFLFFLIFFIINYSNTFVSLISSVIILSFISFQYFAFAKGFVLIRIFKSNMLLGGVISLLIVLQNYL